MLRDSDVADERKRAPAIDLDIKARLGPSTTDGGAGSMGRPEP